MASPAEIGPRYWARLHAWAEEFRQEIAGECGCGEFAVMAVGALHDLVNAKLGKPLYAPENFRIFRDAIDAVELSVSGHAHQHPPEQGGLFGPAEPPSKEIVWDRALRRAEQPEQSKEREAVFVQGDKEPWQMTKGEYQDAREGQWDATIGKAIKEGRRKGSYGTVSADAFLQRYRKYAKEHEEIVQSALSKKLAVPLEVLAEYPDLVKSATQAPHPIQEGTPWPTEAKGQYAQRIRWCNTPEKARESILNWRPLRNLLYQGIAYQVAVEVCEAGFGGDQYQVSIGYRAEGAWRKGYLTGGQVKALRGTAESMGASLFKEVLTRDPGVLIFQVTLPGAEAEDLVLKPQFPEEKPREERVDPKLQPVLFQGVAATMGSTWPDPTYDPLEEDGEEEDTERDGPTIRHKVKLAPRKTGRGDKAMPQDKRPPKAWWESCIRGVQGDDKAAICGRIWTRVRPSVKARIKREGEVFQAAQVSGAEMSNAFLSMVLGGAAQAVGAAVGFALGDVLSKGVRGNPGKPVEPTFQVVRCQEDETWDEKAQVCRPKDQGVAKGRSGAGLPAVVNPGYVEGDQAQVDIGNLLEELDVILKNPQTMGEVDANTLRVVRG